LDRRQWGRLGASGTGWRTFAKLSSFDRPANTFVFVDEREDSINDGYFVTDMTGYKGEGAATTSGQVVDYPAAYYNGGCHFTFADSHSEIHT